MPFYLTQNVFISLPQHGGRIEEAVRRGGFSVYNYFTYLIIKAFSKMVRVHWSTPVIDVFKRNRLWSVLWPVFINIVKFRKQTKSEEFTVTLFCVLLRNVACFQPLFGQLQAEEQPEHRWVFAAWINDCWHRSLLWLAESRSIGSLKTRFRLPAGFAVNSRRRYWVKSNLFVEVQRQWNLVFWDPPCSKVANKSTKTK